MQLRPYPIGNPAASDTILDEEKVNFTLGDPSVISKDQDDRYYNMLGDYFMIPISEVKNINITYYQAMEG